jgi:Mg2+/Co2+ transporter CorB
MVRSRLLSRVDTRDRDAAFSFAILSYGLFSALDVMTTIVALGQGLRERSAFGASLWMQYGAAGLWVAKAAVVGLIVVVLAVMPRRIAVWVATAFALVTAVAVIGNLHALR